MKVLKKYAYQSPETVILSLETELHLLNESLIQGPDHFTEGGTEGGVSGGLQAPWRY